MTVAMGSGAASVGEPLLSDPQPQQYIVVLPPYVPYRRRCRRRLRECCPSRLIGFTTVFLCLTAATYLLWPSDPKLSMVHLRLDRFSFRTSPLFALDVTLDTTIKIWNSDFYSFDYESLLVTIGYRGKRLGYMTSDGGHIRARGTSYVNGTLRLDGVEMLNDAIPLIEDLAKGAVTFDTVSEIRGKLGLFFFDLPLKTKISCEVIVNTHNQTIAHQNCYPEV